VSGRVGRRRHERLLVPIYPLGHFRLRATWVCRRSGPKKIVVRMRKRNTLLQLDLGPQEADCRHGRLNFRGCRTTIRRGRWYVRLSRRDPLGLIDRGHGNFAAGFSQKGIRIGLDEFQSQVVRGRSRGDVSPL